MSREDKILRRARDERLQIGRSNLAQPGDRFHAVESDMRRKDDIGLREKGLTQDQLAEVADSFGVVRLLREGVTAQMLKNLGLNDFGGALPQNALILEDVEPGASYLATFQGIPQRPGID